MLSFLHQQNNVIIPIQIAIIRAADVEPCTTLTYTTNKYFYSSTRKQEQIISLPEFCLECSIRPSVIVTTSYVTGFRGNVRDREHTSCSSV